MRTLFTSESVTEGHPDKVADQVSDAVLDALLREDPFARVACETMLATGLAVVSGEISTRCYVDIPKIIRSTIIEIGYTSPEMGFDGRGCAVLTSIQEQSADIAMGVDRSLEERRGQEQADLGAGDQGMVFGYACDETEELMPLPITLAHSLSRRLAAVRHGEILPLLRPDGKTQVTVVYEDGQPVGIDTVVVSTQHAPEMDQDDLAESVRAHVIAPVLGELLGPQTRVLVNPTGRFVAGGPAADTGLTGRKIIVDTYGGSARHGGGAFSGKDPTKVDRSGSYAARHVAKNMVAAGLAKKLEVQIAYVIGVAKPVSIRVDTYGTGIAPDATLAQWVSEVFDLRPQAIIKELDLRRPIYRPTAAYGHFGRPDLDLPWERLDRVPELSRRAGSTPLVPGHVGVWGR